MLTLKDVLRLLPLTFSYFLIGLLIGFLFTLLLFNLEKSLARSLVDLFSFRLLVGLEVLGPMWFMINNFLALLLMIVASFLILLIVYKTPTFLLTTRLKRLRKYRARAILTGLYIVPIGGLILNGFVIATLLSWTWLTFGWNEFKQVSMLLIPHGLGEILALLLATSLALSCINCFSELILAEKWERARERARKILWSKTTLYLILGIALLLFISGLVESLLIGLI